MLYDVEYLFQYGGLYVLKKEGFQPMYHYSAVLGGTSVVKRTFNSKHDMEEYVADSEEKYVAGPFLEEGEGFLFLIK